MALARPFPPLSGAASMGPAYRNAAPCRWRHVPGGGAGRGRLGAPDHAIVLSAGRNVAVTAAEQGGYTAAFARAGSRSAPGCALRRLPRLSVRQPQLPTCRPWTQHLGDARTFIDLVVDQSADGLELVPGAVTYTYNGNWKMQIENSADAYHFAPTHLSYLQILGRRRPVAGAEAPVSVYQKLEGQELARGSVLLRQRPQRAVGNQSVLGGAPALSRRARRYTRRVGEVRTKWMFHTRNVLIFPNLQLLGECVAANPRQSPARRRQDRDHHLLHRAQGRERARRARAASASTRSSSTPAALPRPTTPRSSRTVRPHPQAEAVDWYQGYMRGLAVVRERPQRSGAGTGGRIPRPRSRAPSVWAMRPFSTARWREWRRRLGQACAAQATPALVASRGIAT